MRLLVCGSRHFNDLELMKKVLRGMFDVDDTVTLIHGDDKGSDRLSERALAGYLKGGLVVRRFPAEWDKYGKAAGPIRNQQMLFEGKPDKVLAFLAPDSRGTKNMIEIAQKAGVPVEIVNI